MYCQAFRVNFELKNESNVRICKLLKYFLCRYAGYSSICFSYLIASISVPEVPDSVLIRICAIHRPSPDWKHDDFIVAAQVYHGTRPIGMPVLSQPSGVTQSLYPRVLFNSW